jgi:hypothetical protein
LGLGTSVGFEHAKGEHIYESLSARKAADASNGIGAKLAEKVMFSEEMLAQSDYYAQHSDTVRLRKWQHSFSAAIKQRETQLHMQPN